MLKVEGNIMQQHAHGQKHLKGKPTYFSIYMGIGVMAKW